MGENIRAFDWKATPLGPPDAWPITLRTLVELLLVTEQPMFLAWGPERIWLYNDAFLPIAGRKHPDALGRPIQEVWAEAWTDLGPLIDRVFGGEPVRMTDLKLFLDRKGIVEEAHFDFSYTPIRGGDADVLGLFGVCSETTERILDDRRQVAALERQRDRIFEMSRDLFGIATFDGYLKSINPAWSRQLGRSDEELLSRPFAEIIHPDDLALTGDVVATLQAGEPVHQFHVRLLKADGTPVSFAWSAVPEQAEGSGDFYTVGRDITEDEQREEALRQSQKMEAMGQLTGGLAHDFNNLLQAAHGNLDLIRRMPDDPSRVARWAENAMQATERGTRLTAQLLAFSRSQKLEIRPMSVGTLVAEMDDMLRGALGPLIGLSIDLGEGDLGVLADPTQLELALLNLAINARDAMPDGGDLSIVAGLRTIDDDPELKPGHYVEIRVADTGTGMPPAIAARAFDPFFTTKQTGKGTGLGLSQVYGMARQAGGTARIEAYAPRGTIVVLLLECVEAPEKSAPAGDGKDVVKRVKDKLVLVVDDDPDVRLFLSDSLVTLGFAVIVAEDGEQGLAALEKAEPDLLLVDFAMPGLTGAEVANRARARRPGLPIIFASGYADTEAIEKAVGMSAILLRKPFGIAELDAVVQSATAP